MKKLMMFVILMAVSGSVFAGGSTANLSSCLVRADVGCRTADMTFNGARAADDYLNYYGCYTPKCKVCASNAHTTMPCNATGV